MARGKRKCVSATSPQQQGGLGSWTSCGQEGKTTISRPGSGEGRKRQRWCPQGELQPPVAPKERGAIKTGRSCWSGSLTPGLALPDNDSPRLTSPKASRPSPSMSAPDTSHHSLLLPDHEQAPWPSPADPPPGWGHGLQKNDALFLSVPPHPRLQVVRKPGDRLRGLILCLGSLPFPPLRGLWTAICSSLRNSSSLTLGSWLAEPEWKISGANGAAMQKPEPRTQPWSGSAALARRGQALLPHILSHAERPGLPPPAPLGAAKHLHTQPSKGTLASPLWGEGRGVWDGADPRGEAGS